MPLLLETLAALLGLIYVLLAARHNLWAWPAALLSSGIYAALMWADQLPMQSLLHSYYVLMALLGWVSWHRSQQSGHTNGQDIRRMRRHEHALMLFGGALLTWLAVNHFPLQQHSQSPWLDSATSIYALLATWLIVRQKLENWLYWIAIDSISCLLFVQTGHLAFAALYALYTGIALYGYLTWRTLYQAKNSG